MTREQFDALVRQAEAYAERDRTGYRTRVALLAIVGYAYVWLILIAIIAAVVGLIWVALHEHAGYGALGKLVLALGVLAFVIVRALWVRFPPPRGIRVRRNDAPRLFDLVQTLAATLKTPRFHRVLVTDDFNAAVSQDPRLGPFGWYRNYLLLGVPLMQALSPEEFRAVLAHELGHLSREHGRFGSWIYRIRMMWARLVEQLDAHRHWGQALFDWFLKRWAPYFSAYSLVLARTHEYEADRFAAELAGKDHLARALAKSEVTGAYLQERYWPAILRRADANPQPPTDVLSSLAAALRSGPTESDELQWLEAALRRKTGHDDTHPSLSDRLAALGVPGRAARPVDAGVGPSSAAEFYFGDLLPQLVSVLEQAWAADMLDAWEERHQVAAQARRQLAEFDARAVKQPLPVAQAWERARLTLELQGEEAALPRLTELVAHAPEHAAAQYTLGRLLLERHDPAGVDHITRAVDQDPGVRLEGYELISRFYERQGREQEADEYRRRAWAEGDQQELAAAERQDVGPRDRLLPHDLSPDEMQRLREEIEQIPDVEAAFVARKDVRYLVEQPFYVVGIELRLAWYRLESDNREAALVERVAKVAPLRGQWYVLSLNRHSAEIWRNLKRVPGAELLRRRSRPSPSSG